ncbi:MAG TPA: SIMPL domain-containing protein [Edaphobacter sp.]|nr:SIMPL domain-containing protein [Edaphobacter sp.]
MIQFRTAALAVALTSLAASSQAQTIQVNRENRTIAITATDKVTAIADQATLHIGFIAYGPDSNTAYATGSRLSNAIVKALTDAGVPKETIQSENQQIAPVQNYQVDKLTEAQKAQRQFQVQQSWTVKTQADAAAKTLDLAVKAGANQSGQIEWGFKDENAPEAEAAAKALKRARAQAEQMASSLSAKLGALLYASNEVQPSGPRPMFRAMAAAPAAMDKVQPLAINPREVEKTATVYAVFAIE